jgi:hypothetical protein
MRTLYRLSLAALSAAAVFVAPVAAQRTEDFNWNRAIPAGKVIEIKGVNGGIKAVGTNGSEVKVHAAKHSKKSNVADVRIQVVESGEGVTICAVYPTPSRGSRRGNNRPNECTPGDRWSTNTDNNDVEVDWTVEVPRGVLLSANTVNGNVTADRMQGDVKASTVNGNIDLSTTGIARANTVNGSLDIRMGRTDLTRELHFGTVNGGVRVTFPSDLDTQVQAETVNGDIDTDWPLTVRGRFGAKNLNGTIGRGGRVLSLSTVNGDIEIRKR